MRVAHPPAKPVLIFDGDCNFCRRWIARWQEQTGDRVEYLPFQDRQVAERFPEISREVCEQSVQFVDTDGSILTGAEAVFRARGRKLLPGFAAISEWCYRFVARHRTGFSWVTRALWGAHVERPTFQLSRWVFLRLLGIIYLIAFVSLGTQIDGLVGSHGIMPASALMEQAHAGIDHNGLGMYWLLPTLCWFSTSDAFLHFLCWGGALLSVLVIAGIATAPALFGSWMFYLSLSVVGDVFLGYQWDALLLEVGLLAIFFAPWRLTPRSERSAPPVRLARWMLWWLLFRLMLSSGVVKLASSDPVWWNLTALTLHYETQPLPTWIGWYAHQLPVWFQKFSCGAMFGIELVAPFLIFGPRRLRLTAAGAITLLMVLIALTGNYCFFNLLTLALCVLLVDDATVQRFFPAHWRNTNGHRHTVIDRLQRWFILPVAVPILMVTVVQQFLICRVRVQWPKPVIAAYMHSFQTLAPFRSVNRYGLFAVMTTTRPEIIVEGSNDALEWKTYEFNYKPGDLSRRPRFVAPHQPRVDWQMWFAALGDYRGNPWFLNMCAQLMRNTPEVTRLLATNPFPDSPPRYIRARVFEYHFTDWATRRATGEWWRRELKGPYCPILSLREN